LIAKVKIIISVLGALLSTQQGALIDI